jgi:hypothetical protein
MYSGRRYRLGLSALALLVVGIPGCGSDEGESTEASGPPPLTKAQFLKKGNAICRKGTKEMARRDIAAWKKYGGASSEPDPETSDKVALALLPVREKEIRLLRSLGLPRENEGYVDEMLSAWEEGIEKGREDPRSLRTGRAFSESYSMGLDYGLIDCWLS